MPETWLKRGDQLVIASHNRGKIPEFGRLLAPLGLQLSSAADYGLPEPEETGTSFAENALIKAQAAAKGTGILSLADDSGLAVTALNGDPGIYSARWAGATKDFAAAMQKIENLLVGQTDRSAKFVTVLALCYPDGTGETFVGEIHGEIVWPPRGTGGFGYDAIFQPDGYTQTFAEMSAVEKDKLSHRAQACAALLQKCGAL